MGSHKRASGGEFCIEPEGQIGVSGEKGHSEDPPDLGRWNAAIRLAFRITVQS